MGMRGSGDTALSATIQTELLEDIVTTQRKILSEIYGAENVSSVAKVWCLYKEVQGYYEAGMTVPEDITLLWADDNWGNIRRLPTHDERGRTGGAGVYFHFDYVGLPRDYKWVNTIQLQRTWEQLNLAYQREARRIWVVNVGDLKTLEIPMSHFFDLAYDFERWGVDSSLEWLKLWSARGFGDAKAGDIASVLNQYGRLAGRRKFELLEPITYSTFNCEEADRVLAEWDALAAKAQAIYDSLSVDQQPAFFELVLHPVLGGAIVHDIHISSARNYLFAGQGRNSANTVAAHMLARFRDDHSLTVRYNELLDGKWAHMMDQTHLGYTYWYVPSSLSHILGVTRNFEPRQQPMRQISPPVQFVQTAERSLRGDLAVSTGGTNASVPGDDHFYALSSNSITMVPIDPFAVSKHYIDIFNVGTKSVTWTVQAPPYVKVSETTGTLALSDPDARVYVTVDWASAPTGSSLATINVTSSNDYGTQVTMPTLVLPINHTVIPASFSGFVESDAHISIEAEHYARVVNPSASVSYTTLPDYGRTLSGVTLLPATAPSQSAPDGPTLEYPFYTFTNPNGLAKITVILGTGLNADPARPLRYAVQVDQQAPQAVKHITDQAGGATPVGWGAAVTDAAWTSIITNVTLGPGEHTLRFWALEPGVVLQKIVIDLGGVRQSYLGPPESFRK